jgi:aminobenzoyl-glutamate utilization protein B
VLDLMTTPSLIASAKDYFNTVQLKDTKYDPVLSPQDQPAIHLNKELMEQMRPQMTKYYFNPKKYSSYLEQLGIAYPGVPAAQSSVAQ